MPISLVPDHFPNVVASSWPARFLQSTITPREYVCCVAATINTLQRLVRVPQSKKPQCLTTTSCKTPTRRSECCLQHRWASLTQGCSYDFEYEDDDDEQGGDVDIENKYYNAKQMKADNPEEAIDEFLGVPPLEAEKGEW